MLQNNGYMQIPPIDPDYCIENQIYTHSKKNHCIYLVVVVSILVILVLLPFISIDIVIQSAGNVRPVTEKVANSVISINIIINQSIHLTA